MTASTALITHASCLGHTPPRAHPECADRLRVVLRAMDAPEFADLAKLDARPASIAELRRAHSELLIDCVKELALRASTEGYARVDPDTFMCPRSLDAALQAAGAVVVAVDEIAAGSLRRAFCAVRPPGHHAERDRAMGFCLFNNVAIGALHAREAHNFRRVAVIDFDVHHGNGTQDIFENDEDAFYGSSHQFPFYPGTGDARERGIAGNVVNVPLNAGAGGSEFREAFKNLILPALDRFAPDFVFISAGFDAHFADPLASLQLREDDFAWATAAIVEIANRHCDGRIVSVLEGGYDLDALARSAAAHVRALMET